MKQHLTLILLIAYSATTLHALATPDAILEADWLRQAELQLRSSNPPTNPPSNSPTKPPSNPASISPRSSTGAAVLPRATQESIRRGKLLAADLKSRGVDCAAFDAAIARIEASLMNAEGKLSKVDEKALYFSVRRAVRKLSLRNPLLDFDDVLLTKRIHGSYNHMSDQYLGWWSRPGGGLYMMKKWKSDSPTLICLTESFEAGSFMRPSLSYDGRKIIFAYCKHYPHLAKLKNKVNKYELPEDSFYQVFEMNIDGSGLRQLTHGKYNNFDARYLPDGRIVFLSTRRGQFLQCGKISAMMTLEQDALPEVYVRCGGGPQRPCAVYTLHSMDADGGDLIAISGFEMFEWTPFVSNAGTIMYARWDYVDRHNNSFMSLWETNPDGTNPRHVYGNYTRSPHCIFEAQSIPGSRKLLATASAHHSVTGGSLILLEPTKGADGAEPITRLTPEVCFPETEGWPDAWYANPWPLSEDYLLTAWSDKALTTEGRSQATNAMGAYLYDSFGNLTLLHRDPSISTMHPIPVRKTTKPPVIPSKVDWHGAQTGVFLLSDIYKGILKDMPRGSVKGLRLVGVPPKTQPTMNSPNIGMKHDDPGKVVLGTVPVEEDGSAHFSAPSGLTIFFQALDKKGVTVQTMRTGVYLQPGQTLSCVGCHESKAETPGTQNPIAFTRGPSRLKLGPEGSWPLRYDKLVQPVLDTACVKCHDGTLGQGKSKLNLAGAGNSYTTLTTFGDVSLERLVKEQLETSVSLPNQSVAQRSSLLSFLRNQHQGVTLTDEDMNRFVTWMDTYAQFLGHFSDDQEKRLISLKKRCREIIE